MDSMDKQAPASKSAHSGAGQRNSAAHSFFVRAGAGIVYAALFMGSLALGAIPTAVFIAAMSFLCCVEFYRMVRIDGKVPNEFIGLVAALLFPLSALVDGIWLTVLNFILALALGLWYIQMPRVRLSDVAVTFFGPIYTGYMLSAVVLLRASMPGFEGTIFSIGVCASLWISDSFAYMVGSKFGKHKMAPKISPKKSWEGFFGGLAGSVLTWLVIYVLCPGKIELWFAALCGVIVSIMGVCGDLIESRIKRGVGVKDSGNLIPGHGGMLDRSDSLIFGVITAYLLLHLGGVL